MCDIALSCFLKIACLWHDVDMLEVRVSAWNGRFGGAADAYISHGELAEAANSLAGFPQRITDTRALQPSAIDSFVAELRQIELTRAGAASLGILDIS